MLISIPTLTSCSGDKYKKELLCTNLYSSYTATADFVLSNGEKNTVGKADISKGDFSTVVFTAPEEYSGISIKSDSTGKEDILSFEFSGIPASVPKSIASDISLMFSLFSNEIPSKINSLDETSFRNSPSDDSLYEVFFTENGISYKIVYSADGVPRSFDAGNDKISVSIEISDYTPAVSRE